MIETFRRELPNGITLSCRASGRRNGSRYCRDAELESVSHAVLTSSGSGVLWSR